MNKDTFWFIKFAFRIKFLVIKSRKDEKFVLECDENIIKKNKITKAVSRITGIEIEHKKDLKYTGLWFIHNAKNCNLKEDKAIIESPFRAVYMSENK